MKIQKLWYNKLLRFIVGGVIFITAYMIYRQNFSTLHSRVNRLNCQTKESVKSMDIHGIISVKKTDSRNLRFFSYFDGVDTIESDIFVVEVTEFYSYLNIGDSISKEVGSLEFKVTRMGIDSTHILKYNCK